MFMLLSDHTVRRWHHILSTLARTRPYNRLFCGFMLSLLFSVRTKISHLNTHLSLSSCPWLWQLSENVPMDAGFLCNKALVLRSIIKCALLRPGSGVCPSSLQYTFTLLSNSTASKCFQEISKKIRMELSEPRDLIHWNHTHNETLHVHTYSQHNGRLVAANVRKIIYRSECYKITSLILLCFRNTLSIWHSIWPCTWALQFHNIPLN